MLTPGLLHAHREVVHASHDLAEINMLKTHGFWFQDNEAAARRRLESAARYIARTEPR